MERNSFIGLNGFIWWIGIVENRMDPLNVGRCQVRIFGWHNENKNEIPSEDLPWAQPILPTNAGTTFSTPKEGDMVVGFFMDAHGGQFPVMMGILPGIPDKEPDYSKGFSDPRTSEQLQNAPAPPKKVEYKTDGSGVKVENKPAETYPNKENLDEPTSSRMVRNENIEKTPFNDSKENTVKNVPVAKHTNINSSFDFVSGITSGFGLLSSIQGIFSKFSSLPGISNIAQEIEGKVSGAINLPASVASKLSSSLPNISQSEIKKATNVGVISSTLTDVGAKGFNAADKTHIEKLNSLPNIETYNFDKAISKYNAGLDVNFDSLKSDLSSSGIDISNVSNTKLAESINSGFDVNTLSNTVSNLTGFDVSDFTQSLNKLGVNIFTGSKQSSSENWREPKPAYNAKYPYNKSIESESGHLLELDDSPKQERVYLRHRSGTFIEMQPDGTQVEKVVKDKYQIIMADDHVEIMGECKVSIVNSNVSVYVKKDCTLQVDGNLNTTVKKDWNMNIDGSITWNVGKDFKSNIKGDYLNTVGGKTTISSSGEVNISSAEKATFASLGKMYLISVDSMAISAPTISNNSDPEEK